jgi:hypothetical protein
MSRFRFSALLALSLGVVAVLLLRRDRRQMPVVAQPAPAPAPPAPVPAEPVATVEEPPMVEEPVVEEPVIEAPVAEEPVAEEPQPVAEIPPVPVQQLYPETDGVSDPEREPDRSYWQVPPAPPAHWSDPPQFGERQSA